MIGNARLHATLDTTKMLRWEIPTKNENKLEAEEKHYKRLKNWQRQIPKLKDELDTLQKWRQFVKEAEDFRIECDTGNVNVEEKMTMAMR